VRGEDYSSGISEILLHAISAKGDAGKLRIESLDLAHEIEATLIAQADVADDGE
jgi:hypothetical protein